MDDHLELLLIGQQYKKFQELLYRPMVHKYGISILDIRILMFLYEHEECDTAKDIVETHCLTKSYVSKAIETLIDKEFLARKHDYNDRRYIHLELQKKADSVIEDVKELRNEMFRLVFNGVSKEEIDVVRNVAEKINSNMTKMLTHGKV